MEVFFNWLSGLGDKVFTEAGILAFILFWICVYLTWDNRCLRNERNKDSKDAFKQIYELGTAQTKTAIETNNVLDKVSDTVHILIRAFERAGILERKANDEEVEKTNRS